MRIEFDIKDEDAATLLEALEFAAARAASPTSFQKIQTLINEIRSDITNGAEIFFDIKERLKNYTNGSIIGLDSNFRTQLGISLNFVESSEGLLYVLNWILEKNVRMKKPTAATKKIKLKEIHDLTQIKDLVELITDHYDKSK
jgi:hypothetical protein